jgi:hypothetical protein
LIAKTRTQLRHDRRAGSVDERDRADPVLEKQRGDLLAVDVSGLTATTLVVITSRAFIEPDLVS